MSNWMVKSDEVWTSKEVGYDSLWQVIAISTTHITLRNIEEAGEYAQLDIDRFEKNWWKVDKAEK